MFVEKIPKFALMIRDFLDIKALENELFSFEKELAYIFGSTQGFGLF